MSKAPGYAQRPNHRILETPLSGNLAVKVGSETVAESADVIRVAEDGSRVRYYFKRDAVGPDRLKRSATTTTCPFKGTASYFDLNVGGRMLKDVVWSYENPYDEHLALKNRLAFYEEKIPGIRITGDPSAGT